MYSISTHYIHKFMLLGNIWRDIFIALTVSDFSRYWLLFPLCPYYTGLSSFFHAFQTSVAYGKAGLRGITYPWALCKGDNTPNGKKEMYKSFSILCISPILSLGVNSQLLGHYYYLTVSGGRNLKICSLFNPRPLPEILYTPPSIILHFIGD